MKRLCWMLSVKLYNGFHGIRSRKNPMTAAPDCVILTKYAAIYQDCNGRSRDEID